MKEEILAEYHETLYSSNGKNKVNKRGKKMNENTEQAIALANKIMLNERFLDKDKERLSRLVQQIPSEDVDEYLKQTKTGKFEE